MARFVAKALLAFVVSFGALEARACLESTCACLDADGDGSADDHVCCGGEAVSGLGAVTDALEEQHACGISTGATGPLPPAIVLAGRISADGIQGCGCVDVNTDGTAEVTETVPPGEPCAEAAAAACLSGHQPPGRVCATVVIDGCP